MGVGDAVRQPVVPAFGRCLRPAHELPDVFHRVKTRAFRRQGQQSDVVWYRDVAAEVPRGLIQQQHGVLAGADHGADLGQVQGHRRGVAERQHQGGALAVLRADGAEDRGRRIALVLRRRGSGAALYPAAGIVVSASGPRPGTRFLARLGRCPAGARCVPAWRGSFVNASMTPSA